jgi:hypothetical protein
VLPLDRRRVVGKPELVVFRSHERFDADGNLIDETTKTLMTELLDALQAKVREPLWGHRDAARGGCGNSCRQRQSVGIRLQAAK